MRVSLQTLGCKVNFAEMAELGDRLARAGFSVSEEENEAEVCVVNSCTVTAQADRKLRTLVHSLRRRQPGMHLILTGCHVDNPNPRISAVPLADAAFPNARKSEVFDYIAANFAPGSSHAPSGFNRSRFFLKVQDGCNHRCTYCIVWRTRGPSRSERIEALLDRARQAVADGYGEVVLTGVDLGAYGRDRGESLALLVRRLLESMGEARLRLSSVNANDFTPELIELTAAPRFCRHLHIPLQSGSDRILKRMGRGYRRRDYLGLVAAVRQQRPEMAITADIIVGFPGETQDDFAETQSIAAEAGLSGMHVFRYSARAGTAAPRLGMPVDSPLTRERSGQLQAQAETQRRTYESRFINGTVQVVWDRRQPRRLRGLSDNYITVYAADGNQRLGSLEEVRPIAAVADGLLCG
jgi:threonylcarbamoyladenosine tRNA methylthiotransferase MtaB